MKESAKAEILRALTTGPLRVTDLFARCKKVMKTRVTLNKYLDEMENLDQTITRTRERHGPDKRVVWVKEVLPAAAADFAFQKAFERIQRVAAKGIRSQQSQEEYLKLATAVLPPSFADETAQRKADAVLGKQPYNVTMFRAGELVMIAHEAFTSLMPQIPGDAYLRVTLTDSWTARAMGDTKPEKAIEIMSHAKAKIFERSYGIVQDIRNQAGRNPELARLLINIDPRWQRILNDMDPELPGT